MIDLDGRTGEGGGQLVRLAVGLAAVTRQAVRITHVRGNRPRGGGLRAQHAAAVAWLAAAADAETEGLAVGSATLVFRPRTSATAPLPSLAATVVEADTAAASTSLMLQAILPSLLFASASASSSSSSPSPLFVTLHGGTHVSWSPTYDYLDQVLFPALETWFGLRVERCCRARGWANARQPGLVELTVHPVSSQLIPRVPALMLMPRGPLSAPPQVAIDATVLAPTVLLDLLPAALAAAVAAQALPWLSGAEVRLRTLEDSGHDVRVYVLLVAKEEAGRIWARDFLGSENVRKRFGGTADGKTGKGKGGKSGRGGRADKPTTLAGYAEHIARRVVLGLAEEVACGGCGDSYLQDQVVVFQALAAGRTSFWRGSASEDEQDLQQAFRGLDIDEEEGKNSVEQSKKDRMGKPFGQGSLHAATARWVTAELLPVQWFRNGTECEGAGWQAGKT